ncbi:phage major capsid protein [Anabaena sp. AL93]|uniref:phage major capsid protein n=1 Tax=Anabaena sp. AL93 TaxID=1678133 RepID=UPI0007FC980E|nr:phage major capsid protein [Anabaena sp. AL93]OBQ17628.1 MAG: hypothetical protein AN486_14505 [Anabaena sp. AL93]
MAIVVDAIKSLQLVVQEEVASLQLNQYPMLSRLPKKVTGQKSIKWNANVGGAGVTGEATTTSVSAYTEDAVIGAFLAIGANRLRHSFQLQKEDIAEAKNAGKGVLRDLFGFEIQSGIRAIMESMSGYVYTGTGLVGLGAVVANAAYAGIDPGTYTAWSCFTSTNGSNRALTAGLLLDMEVGIARKGGNFTAIYTTPEIVAKYKLLFAANVAINNILPGGQADLGFSGVTYAGRPIIQDPYCPANSMFFVNEPEVALYSFGQNNTESVNDMQFAITSLPSSNPDAENYALYCKPQLKVHTRNKGVAALLNITQ